jgi:hypothetical protein
MVPSTILHVPLAVDVFPAMKKVQLEHFLLPFGLV